MPPRIGVVQVPISVGTRRSVDSRPGSRVMPQRKITATGGEHENVKEHREPSAPRSAFKSWGSGNAPPR